MEKKFTYHRKEKLKSRKLTDQLFTAGKSFSHFPVKVFFVYEPSDQFSVQCGVGVSKRYFKKATDRNRIKRLLREALRLNKHALSEIENGKLIFFLLYTDKTLPNFELINAKVISIFSSLIQKLNERN